MSITNPSTGVTTPGLGTIITTFLVNTTLGPGTIPVNTTLGPGNFPVNTILGPGTFPATTILGPGNLRIGMVQLRTFHTPGPSIQGPMRISTCQTMSTHATCETTWTSVTCRAIRTRTVATCIPVRRTVGPRSDGRAGCGLRKKAAIENMLKFYY